MAWPADTMPALEAFYGPIRLGPTGQPTRAWEKSRWGGSFRRRPDCMHFQATA